MDTKMSFHKLMATNVSLVLTATRNALDDDAGSFCECSSPEAAIAFEMVNAAQLAFVLLFLS